MSHPRAGRRSFGSCLLATLTGALILGAVSATAGAILLFAFPDLIPPPLRPLPSPTLQPLAQLPVLEPSPVQPAATSTVYQGTATLATPTLIPTQTPLPTPTHTESPTSAAPTLAPSNTAPPVSYAVQDGQPAALANFANTLGCNWMGVAGLALDLEDRHQEGLTVQLRGGRRQEQVLTGSAPAYGASGFEFILGSQPVATAGAYSLQLFDPTGQPLSEVVYINTYADCLRNLILVIFVQNP